MKKFLFPLSVSLGAIALLSPPAHAGPGGLIMDLIGLAKNTMDGTIPRPFVIGFGALILAIVVLAVIEGRQNARRAAQATNAPQNPTPSDAIRLDR